MNIQYSPVMKHMLLFLLLAGSLFLSGYSLRAQIPFSKGVNLTGWFQAASPRQIQFSKFTKKDFENIKLLGCDVVRLPINLHAMTNGEPDHNLDPLFLEFLDQVIDWTEELQIHLILDNHTFDPSANTDPNIGVVLVNVWSQMAAHFKDRSPYLYYEVLNEPHGIANETWAAIQQTVIDAIRTEDSEHFIVVGAANWNTYTLLQDLPVYNDPKLIYTFHFYDPFVFTHQGASWTDPSMEPLSGVPFPYTTSEMPSTPAALQGTWIESALHNYPSEGNVSKVKSLIDIAANFKDLRNVPVFCGEFGVYIPNSDNSDRVYWYEVVREYLEEKGIAWTIWDYQGGFGLFEKGSNEQFNHDLNIPLLEALSMNVPPQEPYKQLPETKGFLIYDDAIGENIVEASYPAEGTLDYYSETAPKIGNRCIHWTGVPQYGTISFDFKPNLDLSLLESHGHVLEFWVRGNDPIGKFDVRFVDTKTGSADHPWRIGMVVDNTIASWDGEWHKVIIPLSDLTELGSWDNAWFPPEGKYNWKAVDRFEIVSEYGPLDGIDFWFDDIRVSGEEVPYEEPVTGVSTESSRLGFNIFPNPISEITTVQFQLSKPGPARVTLLDINGRQIETLLERRSLPAGNHRFMLEHIHGKGAGLYLIELRTQDTFSIKKVVKGYADLR